MLAGAGLDTSARRPEVGAPTGRHGLAGDWTPTRIDSELQKQGLLGLNSNLVVRWEDMWPFTSTEAQERYLLKSKCTSGSMKQLKTKVILKIPRPDKGSKALTKFSGVAVEDPTGEDDDKIPCGWAGLSSPRAASNPATSDMETPKDGPNVPAQHASSMPSTSKRTTSEREPSCLEPSTSEMKSSSSIPSMAEKESARNEVASSERDFPNGKPDASARGARGCGVVGNGTNWSSSVHGCLGLSGRDACRLRPSLKVKFVVGKRCNDKTTKHEKQGGSVEEVHTAPNVIPCDMAKMRGKDSDISPRAALCNEASRGEREPVTSKEGSSLSLKAILHDETRNGKKDAITGTDAALCDQMARKRKRDGDTLKEAGLCDKKQRQDGESGKSNEAVVCSELVEQDRVDALLRRPVALDEASRKRARHPAALQGEASGPSLQAISRDLTGRQERFACTRGEAASLDMETRKRERDSKTLKEAVSSDKASKKRGRKPAASQDGSNPSLKVVSCESWAFGGTGTASACTQVLPSDLSMSQSRGTQAGPSVHERGVQAVPGRASREDLEREGLEQTLIGMRRLLAEGGRDLLKQSEGEVWREGKRLKRLAEGQIRELEGIDMDTMVLYLHSALKFLEAAHTQEQRKDCRGVMFKGTGDLLLHAASHMDGHTKLRPIVKRCAQVLAKRLAAVAFVRHNIMEQRGSAPSKDGAGGSPPPTSPLENGARCVETLLRGVHLIQSTARDLSDLRAVAAASGGAPQGPLELISMVGADAGMGDLTDTLTWAQHAIQGLVRFDEMEG